MEDGHEWTDTERKKINRMMFSAFCGIGIYVTCLLSCLANKKTTQEYYDLGKHYMAEGRYLQAQVSFSQVIALDKQYVQAYYERAKANEKLDSIYNCIADYTFILDSTNLTVENKGQVLFLRANMYHRLLKDSLACKDYKSACESNHNQSCDIFRKRCR